METTMITDTVTIVDYKPSLKGFFYELAGPWITEVVHGELEEEDKQTLYHPDVAYLQKGGFVFYAIYKNKVAGVVALKRLDDTRFEFAKLFVKPEYRGLGIATKLLEKCISRARENSAAELWLQTNMTMQPAHKLYYKMGFTDRSAPKQMEVLKRTEKIMVLDL